MSQISPAALTLQADVLALVQRDPSVALRLAGDPNTTPKVLELLSALDDDDVVDAIARNPNTPWPTLLSLVDRHPEAFLANPVIPLLLLEDPHLLHHLSEMTLLRLLACETMPALLCSSLASHPAALVREAVALHIQVHGPATGAWQEAVTAAMNQRHLVKLVFDERLLRLTGDIPLVAPWLIAMLASHSNAQVRAAMAASAHLDSTIQAQLAADDDVAVRAALAGNPNVAQPVLAALAGAPEGKVRVRLAGNPATPSAILADLAHDAEEQVAAALARNPNIPQALWEEYATTRPELRVHLAANPLTPATLLEEWACARDRDLRMAVASNPHLSAATADKLAGDRYVDVRRAAAQHPQTSPAILWRMITHHERDMRHAVASNPNAPADLLASIAARVKKDEIIVTLVENPSTAPATLQRLVTAHPMSALTAIVHPHIPLSLCQEWATHIMGVFAARPRHSMSLLVRLLAFTSPLLAPATLAELALHEEDWLLRFVIAQHPELPKESLERLAHDGNCYVRAAVANNPHFTKSGEQR